MRKSPKLFAKILRDAADRIDAGSCGLDEDELMSVAQMFTHRKMNIEQLGQYFNVSRATIYRWEDKGKLPEFRKDCGDKEYLFLDEAEEAVTKWEEEHSVG